MLRRNADEEELFYRKGALVHARLGKLSGLEVLVQIVDWARGEFEFRAGAATPDETIRMDLHPAVMHALRRAGENRRARRGRWSFRNSSILSIYLDD